MNLFFRRSVSVLLAAMPLVVAHSAYAGVMDKLKAAQEKHDKQASQPVKVPIASGSLVEHGDDIKRLMAAFKKKAVGANPFMVYGVRLNWNNQVSVVYRPLTDRDKLEMMVFANGEIQGKPSPFRLTGKDVKVEDNIFDLGKVNLGAIPDLVKVARDKTGAATKAKRTYGASVSIVQVRPATGQGQQVRIVVNVAADDKTSNELVGSVLTALSDNRPAKGASVGQLIADESGKVVDFRMK
ncbi:MAG: hypothetical protein HYS18_03730 [Burkholderiales bacterium]|nr:hypothetical protein [Burkholderiales bacterium]